MLLKTAFAAMFTLGCFDVPANAAEYLVRVAGVETQTTPSDEVATNKPVSKELYRVTVVAVPGQQFYSETVIDSLTLKVRGTLTEVEDGQFEIDLENQRIVETGEYVVGPEGKVPSLNVTSVRSTLEGTLDEPLELGGLRTLSTTTTADGRKTEKELEFHLRLLVTERLRVE